jgi:hypothetical protein
VFVQKLRPAASAPSRSPAAFAFLAAGLALVLLEGCAHESGGAGGGGGGYFDDCSAPYGSFVYGHRPYPGPRSYDNRCGWYGWDPSNFLQRPESAVPARAQIVSGTPRRPHPREVGWRGDGDGMPGSGISGSSGSASSSSGSIQLSQPSPTFSSPPASASPPSPASPPSSRPPN